MKRRFLPIALLMTLSLAAKAQVPQIEHDALVALYNATDGLNWSNNSNWEDFVEGTECTWFGVTCTVNSTVSGISMPGNNLQGSLPVEIGDFSDLFTLNLRNNQLTGAIPTQLGNLTSLTTFLDLSGNQLDGTIPTTLANLDQLIKLDLSNNQMTGSIPAALAGMDSLQSLTLSFNQLDGTLPVELGNSSNLEILILDSNKLSGTIPPEYGDLVNLAGFTVRSNQLTGPIPPELATMGSQALSLLLELRYNKLYVDEPVDAALETWLNQWQPIWNQTQTIAPGNISVIQDGSSATVSWSTIPYITDDGAYEVLSSSMPGGPYTEAGSTSDKTESSLVVTADPDSANFYVVQTRTDAHSNNQSTLISDVSPEANSQCSEPLQTVQVSGAAGIALGTTEPDPQSGFLTLCYDPVNNCYIVPGNQGVQAGVTMEGVAQNGVLSLTSTDFCGSQQNTLDKTFQIDVTPNTTFRAQSSQKQGSLSLGCVDISVGSTGNQVNSGGCLNDSSGNGNFDSVQVMLTDGMSVLIDIDMLFYPDADNPTHIEIPAGMRFDEPPLKRKVNLFIPLDKDGSITVTNDAADQLIGIIDTGDGASVTVDEIFADGFEFVHNTWQWLQDFWNSN